MRNYRGIKTAWIDPISKKPSEWRPTTASAWSILNLCALYDLTAEKKYLGDAMTLFNKHIALQWKARGPHLINARSKSKYAEAEARAYCYGIEALCRLHQQSGDKNLMKMLTEGCRKDFPEAFYDAPLYLAGLYAYVGHKTKNQDYMEEAIEAFLEGFPESQNPPCFFGSNTWSQQSAMLMRSGLVLQYATWKSKTAGK